MSAVASERIIRTATRLIQAGVAGHVFPGGCCSVSFRSGEEEVVAQACGGRLMPGGPAVEIKTPYDLASLTKPFVATAALRMVAAGKITLETRAQEVMSDVRGGIAAPATLEQLLTHRAGLAAWGGLYLDVPHEIGSVAARRWVLSEASRRPAEEGSGPEVYSDLGYMIAGEMLARRAGMSLDRVVATQVTEPLGIADEVFYASAATTERRAWLMRKAPPTERCEWRDRLLQGEVHDENAAALGGVSGHAGMFGTARGVTVLGRAMLDVLAGRSTFLPKDLLDHALEPRSGGPKRIGWDGKSEESAAGKRTSERTFGHLGFTGTSIWCDPERDLVITLLTNRVHPSRANQKIRGFRPAFHDGIVSAFEG